MAKWVSVFAAALVAGIGFAACSRSDNSSSSSAPVYNLDLLGGQQALGDRPAAAPGPASPVIKDTDYYPITRQGGGVHVVITFEDDNWEGVTSVELQIMGSGQHFTYTVVPVDDPFNPGTYTVSFTIGLDSHFMPGTYTLYMGLVDTDGNTSDYVERLLVVKALSELTIASMDPADGSTNVSANAVVRAEFSQQVLDGEAIVTVSDNGSPVAGTVRLTGDGRTMIFTPDALFTPAHVLTATATILVNNASASSTFTIANPAPIPDPTALEGLVFALTLSKDNLVEPQEGKAVFDLLSAFPAIVTKVISVDAGTGAMTSMGGLGQDLGGGVYQQISLAPAFGPGAGQLDNPWFSFGPSSLSLPLAALGLPGQISLNNMLFSGNFDADTVGNVTGFENGVVSAQLDSAEINPILTMLMGKPADLCQLVPVCDADGMVWIRAENLAGPVISGIDYLYGITCVADPDTVSAAAGAVMDVTCTETQDGVGFQGADLAFDALTGPSGSTSEVGTWDYLGETCTGTPPVCTVPASGQVTLQLTVAPAELTAGDPNFRVTGDYASPPGDMATSRAVTVQ